MIAPSGEQIEIVHGDQRAVVVEVGGGLREYTLDGRNVLDGYGADEMSSSGRGQVLIPWPNRIQDGRYSFDGQEHQLPLDDVEEQDAIHGLVRWGSWIAGDRAENRVVMEHALHPQPGYPFSLALSVEYLLSDDGLLVRTTATNRGPRPCPYGSGNHPYLTLAGPQRGFAHAARARRQRCCGRTSAASLSAASRSRARTTTSASRGRSARPSWTTPSPTSSAARTAELASSCETRTRGDGVTLWVDETYPYVMVFTGDPLPDVNRRSLAVEPMTCPPNAFRSGEGLVRLEPGQSLTSSWGIDPRDQPPP